jgi:nicotinate-nucleotide pyrophosphorylase (carboxylating)
MEVYGSRDVQELIKLALREDLGETGDITVRCTVPSQARLKATVTAKQAGVVCGIPLFDLVYQALGGGVQQHYAVMDGTAVKPGDVVWEGTGPAAVILEGERTALNFAQRLSGSASTARRYADLVAGTNCGVYDTRKTTPGMRLLQKHAVKCGGGCNHRIGLYDMVLIKENHIALMGEVASGPAEAVRRCREQLGPEAVIMVEIERLDDLEPVIAAGTNMVLLDNMGCEQLREAVRIRGDRPVQLEASGGITDANLRAVAECGVDRISIGALTHSVISLDLSMRCTIV